jgi:hypothetical protein
MDSVKQLIRNMLLLGEFFAAAMEVISIEPIISMEGKGSSSRAIEYMLTLMLMLMV